ncbi:hypothetical protein QJS10_CPB15g00300 [Acorus calamus]|uniref:Uncharacterized protein n=1 Tax=Acorus calamus TaxID=4465 RepID=A0AAV9D4P2_ACOCL|nr:hypothetical protein QJS10_CPB15g00300 [Acorus calamus]
MAASKSIVLGLLLVGLLAVSSARELSEQPKQAPILITTLPVKKFEHGVGPYVMQFDIPEGCTKYCCLVATDYCWCCKQDYTGPDARL